MKPFLGIDLTFNKKNEIQNGVEFLCCKPSPAIAQSLHKATENAEATIEKASLPKALRVGQWLSGIIGIWMAGIIIGALDEVSFAQGYQNAPVVYWLSGICLILWLLLKLISMKKAKTVLNTEESTGTFSNYEKACEAIFREFEVPADAPEVDILAFRYKQKDGEIKPVLKGMENTPYYNLVFKLFTDSENLYLANLEEKYAIPLNSIRGIRTENKRIALVGWNKEEPIDKGKYQAYKLTTNQYGNVFCKGYHILEFVHGAETWGIWFPAYELPVLEEIDK